MDHLTGRVLGAVLVSVAVLGGCGDDDDPSDGAAPSITTTTRSPESGGIDVPEIPGTYPAAIPSAGFGIAVPEGWQATLLTEDALERLEEATLARPSFLGAAQQVAASGAIFYAAGVDDRGRVAELKIDVQDDADTTPAALDELARSVVDGGQVTDGSVVDDDPGDDRIRVDYRITVPSAEDGAPIDALGSQLFVVDGDRLWSLIVTSEDAGSQTALLQIFETSVTFG